MAPGGEEDGCVAVLPAAGWGCRGDPRRGGMAAVAVAVTPVAARACHGCAAGPRGRCARSSALVWVDKRASEGAFSGLSRSARMSLRGCSSLQRAGFRSGAFIVPEMF